MRFWTPKLKDLASAGTMMAFALPQQQVDSGSGEIAGIRSDLLTESVIPEAVFNPTAENSAATEEPDLVEYSVTAVAPEEWNAKASKRFNALAVKEAYETITAAELCELKALDGLRERQLAPVTIDEILRAQEARRQTDTLIDALKNYVAFYDTRQRSKDYTARKPQSKLKAS